MQQASSPWNLNPFNTQSALSGADIVKLASGFATPQSVQQPQPKGVTNMAAATSGKKNTTGTGAVTPTLGNGKVTGSVPKNTAGTFKDHYSAPAQNGGAAPATGGLTDKEKTPGGKKAPAPKKAKPASTAGVGSVQPGGKKKGGKKFTSIKELRDYANKQGYGN